MKFSVLCTLIIACAPVACGQGYLESRTERIAGDVVTATALPSITFVVPFSSLPDGTPESRDLASIVDPQTAVAAGMPDVSLVCAGLTFQCIRAACIKGSGGGLAGRELFAFSEACVLFGVCGSINQPLL